jgi:hypothetical protein
MGDDGDTAPIKVLYLHGFEETIKPLSPKPASLLVHDDIDLHMPSLGCYLSHRNSPLVTALKTPWFHLTLFVGIVVPEVIARHGHFDMETYQWSIDLPQLGKTYCPPLLWTGLVSWLIALFFVRKQLLIAALEKSVLATYEVAKHEIARFKPDVVVGFSWGGALALHALKEKVGTTVQPCCRATTGRHMILAVPPQHACTHHALHTVHCRERPTVMARWWCM